MSLRNKSAISAVAIRSSTNSMWHGESWEREWLRRVAKGGEESLETAAAQQVKGEILKAIGGPRLKEAESAYAACLASREQALGQQHPDTAIAMLGVTPSCLHIW